jgi:hypothetical protein
MLHALRLGILAPALFLWTAPAGSIVLTGHDTNHYMFGAGPATGARSSSIAIHFVTDTAFNALSAIGISRFFLVEPPIDAEQDVFQIPAEEPREDVEEPEEASLSPSLRLSSFVTSLAGGSEITAGGLAAEPGSVLVVVLGLVIVVVYRLARGRAVD